MIRQVLDAFIPRPRASTIETLGHPAAGVVGWFERSVKGGVPVTRETALTLAAWWCGIRILSETLATLPCIMYRRVNNDSRERAVDDPRYWLVHDEPHPAMSAVTFFEMQTAHVVSGGNAYSRIVPDQLGIPARLEPIMPDKLEVGVSGDQITYTRLDDRRTQVPMDQMLHVLGLGGDGITGWSALKYGARSIGAGLAGENYATGQLNNGATPPGILKFAQRLTKEAREEFRTDWNEQHQGSEKAGNIAILHSGMEYVPVGMTNEAAQLIETRKLNVRDIARILRLPPHMLADLEDSSVKANIEQQAIEFVVYSLAIWLVRWQSTLNRRLLTREERRTFYFEFLLDALLRGDIASRYAAYATARQWGWLSVNDIRRAENQNRIEGGDVYLQPVNMAPAGSVPAVPDSVSSEMQTNLASSLSEILEAGKALRADLEGGQKTILESVAAAAVASNTALEGMRADRQLIRQDIEQLGKVQVRGHDLPATTDTVAELCLQLYRESLRCCVRIEAAAVLKAAERQRDRGESFLTWMRSFYAGHRTSITARVDGGAALWFVATGQARAAYADAWCERSQTQLLAAADGEPAGFVSRVRAVVTEMEQRAQRATPAGESDETGSTSRRAA